VNRESKLLGFVMVMTETEYREIGQYIWANDVPKSEQADTVQVE